MPSVLEGLFGSGEGRGARVGPRERARDCLGLNLGEALVRGQLMILLKYPVGNK